MVFAPSSPVLYPPSSSPAQPQPKKRRLFQSFVSEPTAKKTKLVGGFEVDIDEAADDGRDDGNSATNSEEAGHDRNLPLPPPPVDLDEIDQPPLPLPLPVRPPSPTVSSFSRPLLRKRAARTIPLETSSGVVIDIPIRTKAEAQSYEAIIAERSKTKEGRAKKAYYGIEIHKLIDEARLQRVIDENEREAQRQKASEQPRQPSSSSSQVTTVKASNTSHLLWTEKYRARKFTELVGDERTHRQVLRWLKAWDPIVFPASCRRTKMSTKIYHDDKNSNSNSSSNSNRNDDNNNAHHRKILLLTGPPGLGKTTLAHVCARQAGYEVLEINASDDRSRDVVRGRIKDALATETVRGIQEPGKERKIGRPVCVVVDEVDGVVTGSGSSGEGGFMKALIDLVQLDQRNLAYQQQQQSHQSEVAGRRKKKGDRFRMLRPLILVCNDVYAPSLRPLRTSGLAEIVHVRKPALEKVVSRLKNVFEQEHIPCDPDAVRRICASAWGLGSRSSSTGGAGEGDIRGILVNAEWIAHKFRARHAASDHHRPRLTRRWVDSHLAEASSSSSSSSATSASTTSAKGLGRGGVREVIDRIFIDGAGLPNLSGTTRLSADEARLVAESKSKSTASSIGISDLRKRAAIAHLREMIDQCGEYDRVMTDCFATYPLQVYQDDVRLTKPNMGYDWLHFHDLMSSRVYGAHDWELLPYLNTGACGFHDLFASVECGGAGWGIDDYHGKKDGEDEEADGPGHHHPFAGVRADFAANEAQKANRTMLAELQDRFQAELLRMFSSLDNIATELVPHVVGRMMAPDIKPVVVGGSGGSTGGGGGSVASVRKESEKKCVRTCVRVMNALDVRFEKVKVELEVGAPGVAAGHTRGGFAYRMEPPLDMLTSFHIAKDNPSSSSSAPVRYAVRQVLDQELRKEKAVQAALSRQARSTALGHEIKPNNDHHHHHHDDKENKAPLSKADQIKQQQQQQATKVKRDFFGRVIIANDNDSSSTKTTTTTTTDGSQAGSGSGGERGGGGARVWVSFHEGFSNAVRKPITLKELMEGFV